MPSIINRKNYKILDSTPTGAAGQALQDNFTRAGDDVEALTTTLATNATTAALTSHTSNTSNPHSTTAAQVGKLRYFVRSSEKVSGRPIKELLNVKFFVALDEDSEPEVLSLDELAECFRLVERMKEEAIEIQSLREQDATIEIIVGQPIMLGRLQSSDVEARQSRGGGLM